MFWASEHTEGSETVNLEGVWKLTVPLAQQLVLCPSSILLLLTYILHHKLIIVNFIPELSEPIQANCQTWEWGIVGTN